MRPPAMRPLRPGGGDSELADIGRARPQLDVGRVADGSVADDRQKEEKKDSKK
jgi:hypothetical protein